MQRATIISVLIALLFSLATISAGGAPRGNHSVKATLDSAYIIMGKKTPVHIEVVTPTGAKGVLFAPSDTLVMGVEVSARSEADTTDAGGGMMRIKQDLVIQSFDSGNYTIPPIKYIVDGDTFYSEKLALRVVPVNVDTMTTVHPFAPVASVKAHFWDWVPDVIADYWAFWVAAILFVAAALIFYRFWWEKRAKKPAVVPVVKAKVEPPYDLAIKRLNALHDEELWQKGQDREFYTRLTDILRQYIDSRFGINAMEMTSEQILEALLNNPTARMPEKYMRQVLEIADYVKFAKLKPFSDDNIKAYEDALQFVEATKPVPAAVASATPPAPPASGIDPENK